MFDQYIENKKDSSLRRHWMSRADVEQVLGYPKEMDGLEVPIGTTYLINGEKNAANRAIRRQIQPN
jgi:hypothetical protein